MSGTPESGHYTSAELAGPFGRAQGMRAHPLQRRVASECVGHWSLISEVDPIGEDEGEGGAADYEPEDQTLEQGANADFGEGLFAQAGAD
jgi:hypothetical protein